MHLCFMSMPELASLEEVQCLFLSSRPRTPRGCFSSVTNLTLHCRFDDVVRIVAAPPETKRTTLELDDKKSQQARGVLWWAQPVPVQCCLHGIQEISQAQSNAPVVRCWLISWQLLL